METQINCKPIIAVLSASVFCFGSLPSAAAETELIASWNFNVEEHEDLREPSLAADHGTGTLLIDPAIDTETITAPEGDSLNAVGADEAGSAFSLRAGSGQANNGAHLTFQFSTDGLQDPIVTYASRETGSGFDTHEWHWSTDGENYEHAVTLGLDNDTAWHLREVDLTGNNSLEDHSGISLRVFLDGATDGNGTNRIDNLQINATAIPEPSAYAAIFAVLAGTGAILYRRRRRI